MQCMNGSAVIESPPPLEGRLEKNQRAGFQPLRAWLFTQSARFDTKKSPETSSGDDCLSKNPGRTFGLRVAAARRLSIGFEAGLAPSSSPAAYVSFPKALCF